MGKSVNAVVKSIKPTSIKPLYFDLGNGYYGYSSLFGNIFKEEDIA